MPIDSCEPWSRLTGVCVAVRGVKAGIEAGIETVVIGIVDTSGCLAATSISRSIWL